MQIQINMDPLEKTEVMAICAMVNSLAREIVIQKKIETLDKAEPVQVAEVPQPVDPQPAAEVPADPQPEPVKRTRRTKSEMEAAKIEPATPPANTPATEVPPVAEQSAAPVTIDDLRSALQSFTSAKGMPAGIDLLKQFGCSRISELAAKDEATKQGFLKAAA